VVQNQSEGWTEAARKSERVMCDDRVKVEQGVGGWGALGNDVVRQVYPPLPGGERDRAG